jgi:hypothetical protein
VLVLADPPEAGWPTADVELLLRLASAIGRRLEGEQLIQLQRRRFNELEILADIGRVIQAGSAVDRLCSEFSTALHPLVAYQQLYVVRVRDDALSEVSPMGAGCASSSMSQRGPDAPMVRQPWSGLMAA